MPEAGFGNGAGEKAALLKAGGLQHAIFNSANFSSIATDAKGVIQIFNVGAERMLGYTADEVMNKITPADISDPQEVSARAEALSVELGTPIAPGFEALVFKASRGIEDIYELTYIRKDGSRFPAVVSVTALRDAQDAIIGYLLIGTDNTACKLVDAERKKLAQRLRDQQFYTRSLIESNSDALMTTDPYGIITDVNRQMEVFTGRTRDELIGAPFKDFFTDPERAEAAIKLALSEKKVTDYELTVWAHDGAKTVVSVNATTFCDRGSTLQGVFAAARDVTERKRMEAELQESAARLRGFLTASPDAVIVIDDDGQIVQASERTEELFGYRSEELIGRPLNLLLPERNRGAHADHLRGYLRAPQFREMGAGLELHARRKDGSEFPAEISLSPYRAAEGLFVIAAVRDITKRHQAQDEVRLSEARFRSAFDAAGHGMAWVGLDDRFLKVNAAYCRIMGYSEDELLAHVVRDISHPDDVAESWSNLCRMAAGEISVYQAEKRYIRKDGAIIWAQLNAGMVRDTAGAPLHYISQIQDITAQKQAEDRGRQVQRMEAVGQLTAGIAHDFNNILGAVIGNLDLVGELLTTDPAVAALHTKEAIDAALFGANLVKGLLAFARQQPLQPRSVDIEATIAGIVPLLRPSLGGRVEIKTSTQADLWPAMADATQVESALLNLALNARDAMPNGGVLTIDAANVAVNGGVFHASDDLKPGDYIMIAVTDSGIGMTPEVVAHAFEPFFTSKEVGAGSGLGLSMVLGTMQQLGGTARIYSEAGHGATVRLFLPRAASVADTPTARTVAPAQPTGTEHILLVEDNDLIRNGVRVMIQSLGYTVAVVPNAAAALALWDCGERFDLVFSDIIMPGQYNGIDLARQLRARDPHIEILLTSGFANPEMIRDDVEGLGLELLPKPYRKASLATRLRAILDRKAVQMEVPRTS